MEYAVLITYVDPNDSTNIVSIILDTVNDTNITARSTVTEHPTVNGTPMADHMYKEPIDMTLSGTFSLNGKKALIIDKSGKSLARIEKIFEDIKNLGIICTISKIKITDTAQDPQFTIRENMVLQSISWTEKINSLSYTFNFKEALRATVQTYEVDPDDRFAPDINYADASNFSDTLLDWKAVEKEVLDALRENDLVADAFLQLLASLGVGALVSIGIGTAIAVSLAGSLVALGVSATTIPVIGLAIAGVAAVILGIFAIIRFAKAANYKVKAFKYYKNKSKQEKEIERFTNFYEDTNNKIRSLDGAIKVWSVSENKSQETLINIDGEYYIFNFEKNNVDSGYAYKLNVSDINDTTLQCTNTNAALSSFTDGTRENALFTTSKSFVYFITSVREIDDTYCEYLAMSEDEKSKLTAEQRKDMIRYSKDDLRNYFICASQINPVDFSEALAKIIQEAIKY